MTVMAFDKAGDADRHSSSAYDEEPLTRVVDWTVEEEAKAKRK